MLKKERDEKELDRALSNISDTIVYLSDTIDDFQTYFRPDKEAISIEIHELLQRALNFALSRVTYKNIKIDINKYADINVKTYVNELVQVVLNILNNAIDAHNELKVEDPFILVEVNSTPDLIFISVEDNAGGIKSQDLPHLFEPYFSTKGKNGTGLGLYMSQMIIQKQFGGEIDVKTFNGGSKFTIKIPKNIT